MARCTNAGTATFGNKAINAILDGAFQEALAARQFYSTLPPVGLDIGHSYHFALDIMCGYNWRQRVSVALVGYGLRRHVADLNVTVV
jgi:hypothetical protein